MVRLTRAGVGAARVNPQRAVPGDPLRSEHLQRHRALHVAHLAHVVVAIGAPVRPPEERVGRGLHQALALRRPARRGGRSRSGRTYRSSTLGSASFIWRNSGAPSSWSMSSRIEQCVPTLPTPTTFRATSTTW